MLVYEVKRASAMLAAFEVALHQRSLLPLAGQAFVEVGEVRHQIERHGDVGVAHGVVGDDQIEVEAVPGKGVELQFDALLDDFAGLRTLTIPLRSPPRPRPASEPGKMQ